jgi:hypothetical protein
MIGLVREAGAVACALWIAMGSPARAAPPTEYEVKAAFLYNFSKFVEWPPGTFANPDDPIKVCFVGSSPLAAVFKETVEGKSANGRRLVVLESKLMQQTLLCNVDFVGALDSNRLNELFRRVDGRPILTVGDDPSFATRGGIIGLTTQQDKVRFEVNMIATRRAGLRLSSQLLKVAVRVIGELDRVAEP